VEDYLAFGRAVETEDTAADSGFTTTAFADKSQGLALLKFESNTVNSLNIGDLAAQGPRVTGKYIFRPMISRIASSFFWFTWSPLY
jgi:hypothetical protein